MRIIFFTNHFFPSVGGVQWSVLRTAEALVRRGHHVTVVTETPTAAAEDDRAYSFTVMRFRVPVRRPFTRFFYWRWMWTQRACFATADVLHFHDTIPFFAWFLPLRLLIRRPRYAVTFHGYEHWPIRLRHRVSRAITARCCQARFAVGDYVRAMYRHPVDAVYIGAPVRPVTVAGKGSDAVFAYAGRFAADTEILPLLRALSRAADRGTAPVIARLAGDGPLRGEIARLANDRLRIEFTGVRMDTTALYDGASHIIATGFLGIFEAFASGIPVIVPACNPLRRRYVESIPGAERMLTILRSAGESEDFFRDAIRDHGHALQDEQTQAAAAFVSHLSWDDIAELCEQWYTPAASGTPRATTQWQVTRQRIDETHAHR